jgi:hypothetical protein
MRKNILRQVALLSVASAALALAASPAMAADLPADVAAKVEKAKQRLVTLAADPAIVAAVREANASGPGGMSNGKWISMGDTDPPVKTVLSNKISLQIAKWEQSDDMLNKIVLRDQKGNLVGASTRPLIFNNAKVPVFSNAIKGQPWSAQEVKPDTSTQVPSVHVAAPVLDAGQAIGVLHAGVTAK